jgi:hypothetical protein
MVCKYRGEDSGLARENGYNFNMFYCNHPRSGERYCIVTEMFPCLYANAFYGDCVESKEEWNEVFLDDLWE